LGYDDEVVEDVKVSFVVELRDKRSVNMYPMYGAMISFESTAE